ncbi:MAG: hypothetical protein PHW63_10535 [Alphaproteobacteria bacterium]|nr:hypothetical protein [Alphaproteobacteria bacterium]
MAIQSPSFRQQDWIAALPAVARNDEDGTTRESFHRAVGLTMREGMMQILPEGWDEKRKGHGGRRFPLSCKT